MTLDEIRDRVNQIEFHGITKGDDEAAHCLEDVLRQDFLVHILGHPDDPELREKVRLVLITNLFDFSRWCA